MPVIDLNQVILMIIDTVNEFRSITIVLGDHVFSLVDLWMGCIGVGLVTDLLLAIPSAGALPYKDGDVDD